MIHETGNVSALVREATNKQWRVIYDNSNLDYHKKHEYDRVIVIESACESVWSFARGIANEAGFYETLRLNEGGFTKLDRFMKMQHDKNQRR